MDINTISEISVTLKTGETMVYKNRGLEKFRKDMGRSPPLGGAVSQTIIVDDDDPQDVPQKKATKKKSKSSPVVNGYQTANLNYTASTASPYEMARLMRQEAEKSSGISFG